MVVLILCMLYDHWHYTVYTSYNCILVHIIRLSVQFVRLCGGGSFDHQWLGALINHELFTVVAYQERIPIYIEITLSTFISTGRSSAALLIRYHVHLKTADQLRHTPYGCPYFGDMCQSPFSGCHLQLLHVHKGTAVVSVAEDFVLGTTKYFSVCSFFQETMQFFPPLYSG